MKIHRIFNHPNGARGTKNHLKEMNSILTNKKGGEKLLSIWWFVILIIIGVGIVAGVYIFYYAEVNVQKMESGILAGRVGDCLISGGNLKENLVGGEIFNVCDINGDKIEKSGKYFLWIRVISEDNCSVKELEKCNLVIEKKFGNPDFVTQCKFKESGNKAKHFADCSELKIPVGHKDKEEILFVFAGVNQEGTRI